MGESEQSGGVAPSEWEVMKVLWEHGPMALGDIHTALRKERDWSYSTVKTLVRRVVAKGWVAYQRVGNSFLYRATETRASAVRAEIASFSRRVLDGLLSPVVAYHSEHGDLTPEDIEMLEQLLEKHRGQGGDRDDADG